MFSDRLLAGALGLFLAFSAGGKLQLWLDEGKVRQRSKGREPRLLSYDETPFSYVSEIVFTSWLCSPDPPLFGGRLAAASRKNLNKRSSDEPSDIRVILVSRALLSLL
jgi:hypothetical protein